MQSETIPLPSDLRWRRLLVLAIFLVLLWVFRQLAPVFICYVIFARALGFIADFIDEKTPLERRGATLVTLVSFFAMLAIAVWALVVWLVPRLKGAREDGLAYADYIAHHPLFELVQQQLGGAEGEDYAAVIKEHALEAVHYATATVHVGIYLGIGLLLGVMYLLERHEIDEWFVNLGRDSISGTLVRWFAYVGDAIAVTVRLQVVVAVFNAVLTLPVLLFLGLPHPLSLFAVLLVAGLLPVVGSFISGAILCVVAYSAKGPWAVAVFVGITFVLAKIEGYVLTPRLAAQHVSLPALLMVVSLLFFEQLFGFVGLFLSFPTLYVATRIHNEWKEPAPGGAAVVIVAEGGQVAVSAAGSGPPARGMGEAGISEVDPALCVASSEERPAPSQCSMLLDPDPSSQELPHDALVTNEVTAPHHDEPGAARG